jgi:amino acid adenylation domain-containing protein
MPKRSEKMKNKNIESSYRLSPMQQGMLFHYQLDPGSGVDIEQIHCSLHEELNIPAFQHAWEQVVVRHSALRTSFRWEGINEPLQDVQINVCLPFEKQDWRDLSPAIQQSKLEEYLDFDRQRGFELSKSPLMRLALFQLGDAHYMLIWTSHHIIADGRSHYTILNEVFTIYDMYCQGCDVLLDRPTPYRNHIDWLQQKDSSKSEAFWRRLLSDFTAPTAVDAITVTRNLDDRQEDYAEREIQIDESITSRLKTISRQHQLTLNTLVQGAWALLLSRYTGEADVVFGAVRACRRSTVDEAESIVGLFINTVPVRVRISPEQDLVPWLKELREQHIAVRDHEQTPLVQVQGWSDVPRGMPLFESIIMFDYVHLNSRLREQGKSWENREFHLVEKTGFPLTLYGYGEANLLLRISYDKRRFDDSSIERMLGHIKTLLEGIAESFDRSLATLPILTKTEWTQLVTEWNDTQVDYPQHLCLHQLFEAQTERTPNAIAVSFEGQDLTYREFNHRANQLAYFLRKSGVGSETMVGVYMERSLEMVIALYGILKAGGAYVPLDPEYPPDRVTFMLGDTQVPVLLTQERLVSRLSEHKAQTVCLDSHWETISQERIENPINETKPENLAYVIYTSGSTGKPKGVMNTHRGICNRLLWMQDTYKLTQADHVLQKTPFSFDVSVWEFFWPLLFGARLVVARPGGHKDSAYLVNVIVEQDITTIHFVPSMLQLFLEDKDVMKCHCLKRVICSGEALPYELQNRFFARLNAELHNLYGPTEAAVDVSYWECRPESDLKIVPIGRPVANTQLYILDQYMQPVPIGVPGELHIGGIQVARGYLNRPELTAEKFIPDPFSNNPEARLYKTGDSVRYIPNGSIEFLGRLDFQVKVRGFRIELGEIETVLSQHPVVREVVVLAREDVPGDKRLAAYVVSKRQSPLPISELREFLKDRLPDYMVPAAIVQLESLPLTPNGKIDRRSLPAPEAERQSDKVYVAPQNELERVIAGIWQEVLQVEKLGVDDNFFDLGGHSLLIMQVQRQLCDMTNQDIRITDMFRFPTIRKLSQYLGQVSGVSDQDTTQKSVNRAQARRESLMRRRQRAERVKGDAKNE